MRNRECVRKGARKVTRKDDRRVVRREVEVFAEVSKNSTNNRLREYWSFNKTTGTYNTMPYMTSWAVWPTAIPIVELYKIFKVLPNSAYNSDSFSNV